MSARRPKVVVLGGGMAAMATAWRLSEPGWEEDLESITVYQRGWRLGGKGASSRGPHGRVEEHGLHIWLGYYENAFRLLREVYGSLDRERLDPTCPIRSWQDAMLPQTTVGLEDRHEGGWLHWMGAFRPNDQLPGEPDEPGGQATVVAFLLRALDLLADFASSIGDADALPRLSVEPAATGGGAGGARAVAVGAVLEALRLVRAAAEAGEVDVAVPSPALDRLAEAVTGAAGADLDSPEVRRSWNLASVMVAVVRGILAEDLLARPDGFASLNDVDFVDWIVSHGAAPEVRDFAFMRGLYDLVFGYEDADPERPGFGAGLAVFLTGKMLFEYKGAIFWKMAAGMGDIVFAPLYEALVRRGVRFEFFHRLDALHLSPDGSVVEEISLGRQVRLAAGRSRYDPLVRVRDLPCFPAQPLVTQLDADPSVEQAPLEAHACGWPDAERYRLRRGRDFDVAVLAVPPAMARHVGQELVERLPRWSRMVDGVRSVATQAIQIWLREDEPTLGWPHPGSTVSAFVTPFDTWASMPQLIEVEDWPASDRPGTIAYFCSVLGDAGASREASRATVREAGLRFLQTDLPQLLPGVLDGDGRFRWTLLCGSEAADERAFESQLWVANVDPSDRYVQSLPGSDRFRLRPDESGLDNLFLAGDWTDCGLNAGCIEAAVLSGLQAANAILGRSRHHRIAGYWMT